MIDIGDKGQFAQCAVELRRDFSIRTVHHSALRPFGHIGNYHRTILADAIDRYAIAALLRAGFCMARTAPDTECQHQKEDSFHFMSVVSSSRSNSPRDAIAPVGSPSAKELKAEAGNSSTFDSSACEASSFKRRAKKS